MTDRRSILDELWEVVRTIPPGRVASYGDVGRALSRPVSGFLVGRWMASAPAEIPWWRVVGKDGQLRIAKRDPRLAKEQTAALKAEGVSIREGQVLMAENVRWTP